MNHTTGKWIFALLIGGVLAWLAFERATDPVPIQQKKQQEQTVQISRGILHDWVSPDSALQIVDPLDPDHRIGDSYIWPNGNEWDVSGFYRRDAADAWHPYIMRLDGENRMVSLSVRDEDIALRERAESDDRVTVK